MADGVLQAFRSNRELQCFVLSEVRATGRKLGEGSYGSVEELKVKGLVCAGKRLHKALVEQGNAGVEKIVSRFLEECKMMAGIRHPHIVQFLGLCYLKGSALPVLVMEQLDRSLDELLESSPSLPLPLKQSLLTDVAQGLLYLHTRNPPIVHRDLSARNVLLTSSLVAKISDLGCARIVNLQPGQLAKTLTRVPGAQLYMPPESFDQRSRYGPRLDIFSFGHLALFTLTQKFPDTLLPATYPDPDNPCHLLARSEVERRTDYIQLVHEQLGEQHPLSQLVPQCLHNIPAQRPSAEELHQRLEAARPQIEEAYGSQHVNVEIARLQVTMMSVLRTKDAKAAETDREQRRLREDRARLQAEVEAKNTQLQQKDGQLQQRHIQIRVLKNELQEMETALEKYRDQQERMLSEKAELIMAIERLKTELQQKAETLEESSYVQKRLRYELKEQKKRMLSEKAELIERLQSEFEQIKENIMEEHRNERERMLSEKAESAREIERLKTLTCRGKDCPSQYLQIVRSDTDSLRQQLQQQLQQQKSCAACSEKESMLQNIKEAHHQLQVQHQKCQEVIRSHEKTIQDMNSQLYSKQFSSGQCQRPECVKLRREKRQNEIKQTTEMRKDIERQQVVEHDHLIHEFVELTTDQDGLLGVLEDTLHESGDEANFEAKKLLCALFQECYDSCKKAVLHAISTQLESLFVLQPRKTEEMEDASRGYGLLLSACGLRTEKMRAQYSAHIKAKFHSDISREETLKKVKEALERSEDHLGKVIELTWKFVTLPNPLIVCQPEMFNPLIHEPQFGHWDNKHAKKFELIYLRPVVYRNYEGVLARKGWVANTVTSYPRAGQCMLS